MRRWLFAGAAAVLLLLAVYLLLLRSSSIEGQLVSSRPVAVVGSGEDAVAVAADGSALLWLSGPEEGTLPQLALESVPKGGQLRGPALEQVHVLAATPAGLRPYVSSSYYGESGVDVELTTGVELRFGSDAQAARKWKAAAAVLASPSVTALDYVNLLAPSRPTIGGSGHALPPPP